MISLFFFNFIFFYLHDLLVGVCEVYNNYDFVMYFPIACMYGLKPN